MLIPGTNIASKIVPFDTNDTFPTHDEAYGIGSYRSVSDTIVRDSIPIQRRSQGMLVYCISGNTTYQLFGGLSNSNWTIYNSSSNLASLTGSLTPLITTSNISGYLQTQINSISGSLQSQIISISSNPPISLQKIYTQNNHGFSIGNAVRYDGSNWVLAQANSPLNSEVLGIINSIPSPNTFNLIFSGEANFPGYTFSPGFVYFLSDSIPGQLTTVEPSANGAVSKPLLYAESISTGFVYSMKGDIITNLTFIDNINSQNISGSKTFYGPVNINGGINNNQNIINSTPYTINDNDSTLLIDTTSQNISIILPLNPTNGRSIKIKKLYSPNTLILNSNTRAIESVVQNLSASLASYAWIVEYNNNLNSWFIY